MNTCFQCDQLGHYKDQYPKKGLSSKVAKHQTKAQQQGIKPIIITLAPWGGFLQARPLAPRPTAPTGTTVGMPVGLSTDVQARRGRGVARPLFSSEAIMFPLRIQLMQMTLLLVCSWFTQSLHWFYLILEQHIHFFLWISSQEFSCHLFLCKSIMLFKH